MSPNPNAPSFDDLLQESRRKKNLENLAQQILGSQNIRARTPSGPRNQQQSLSNSIASRSGISRRPASIPRTNSAPAARLSARAPPASNRSNRPAPRKGDFASDDYYGDRNDDRERDRYPSLQQSTRDIPTNSQSNGRASAREPAVATSFSVRGAAKSEPHIVLAENFAPGTTAADIEAVMHDVGGEMHKCQLLTLSPVVAEMTFVDRNGGQTVIDTFDGKKADGRTLHVYWKASGNHHISRQRSPEAVGFVVDTEPSTVDAGDSMDVDEHTRDREEQNRLREERRGTAPRGPASDQPRESRDRGGRPTGPRADRNQYDDRTRYNSNDARYGNGGGGDRYPNGGGGGRFRNDGGRGGRSGYGGQSYRP